MRKHVVSLATALSLIIGGCTTVYAKLLFEDDFSTGDYSKHNEYFRWGRNGEIKTGDGSSKHIAIAQQPDGEIGYVMKFTYGTWQEVRFHLTESLTADRSERGPSGAAYPELWVSYQIRVPDNYFHELNKNGYAAGQNNKGWLTLWKGDYSDALIMARYEWWPVASDKVMTKGGSYVSAVGGRGHDANPAYVSENREIEGTKKAWAVKPSDRGKWIHYTFHYKVASGLSTYDGVMEIYKNGKLAVGWYDKDLWPEDNNPEHAGFDRGYVMGYHNSGYEEPTTFYIDNFRVGTTAESVGLDRIRLSAPNAPIVVHPRN